MDSGRYNKKIVNTWNFRIISKKVGKSISYSIHEVYYENGNITSWTKNPCRMFGESINELEKDLERMARAFIEPVLDYNDLSKIIKRKGK
jgi:hypothetical protein